MYDGMAQRCGIYRSQLERQWANWFSLNHVAAEYVDQHWHDFVVGEHYVEIKPHGEQFLLAALSRMPRNVTLIVIQGSIFNNLAWSCVRMDDAQYVDCKPIDIHELLKIKGPTHGN